MTVARIRWAQLAMYASWVVLALATLLLVIATLDRAAHWITLACNGVVIVANVLTVLAHRRAMRAQHSAGVWAERVLVMGSMHEAFRRGLTLEEWAQSYTERVSVEAGMEKS